MAEYVEAYLSWLKQNMTDREIRPGLIEVTTPFLDHHNDYTQIYIEKAITGFKVSDAGYILNDLAISGIDLLSSSKTNREKILRSILNRHGLSMAKDTGDVFAFAKRKEEIPPVFHRVLQGMLDINDMFSLTSPVITNLFFEDVVSFFEENEIYHSKNISFYGRSGFSHSYDFLLQRNKQHPGRVVKLMNRLQKEAFERYVFSWNDIKESLKEENDVEKCIILINDEEKVRPSNIKSFYDGFKTYGMDPVLWSDRKNSISMFA